MKDLTVPEGPIIARKSTFRYQRYGDLRVLHDHGRKALEYGQKSTVVPLGEGYVFFIAQDHFAPELPRSLKPISRTDRVELYALCIDPIVGAKLPMFKSYTDRNVLQVLYGEDAENLVDAKSLPEIHFPLASQIVEQEVVFDNQSFDFSRMTPGMPKQHGINTSNRGYSEISVALPIESADKILNIMQETSFEGQHFKNIYGRGGIESIVIEPDMVRIGIDRINQEYPARGFINVENHDDHIVCSLSLPKFGHLQRSDYNGNVSIQTPPYAMTKDRMAQAGSAYLELVEKIAGGKGNLPWNKQGLLGDGNSGMLFTSILAFILGITTRYASTIASPRYAH